MSERPLFDPWRVPEPAEPAGPTGSAALSVRQVNELIRGALARHLPETLIVLGEIGDFSRAGSGHLYFTIKDRDAELRCVMWKSQAGRLRFQPETGQQVLLTGGVEVYTPRGMVQFIVRTLEPRGVGALEIAFRQLREKLARAGLFDRHRKRPLPRFPERIAVITSPSGAAVRDILETLARRYPLAEVLIVPVRVQGAGAAAEIAAAVRNVSDSAAALGGVDVLIVARGGGALEDLWAFNDEAVARALAASRVPVVSGVGHEVDVTIADLAADLRAPTPTAAAELCTPNQAELRAWLVKQAARLTHTAAQQLALQRAQLGRLLTSEVIARPLARLRERGQRVDDAVQRLRLAQVEGGRRARARLHRAEGALLRLGGGAWANSARRRLDEQVRNAWRALLSGLVSRRAELSQRIVRLVSASPARRVQRADERLIQLGLRLDEAREHLFSRSRARLAGQVAELTACDPRRVLERGFSLVRDARGGALIRSISQVRDGQRLRIETADGEYRGVAEDPRQPRLFE